MTLASGRSHIAIPGPSIIPDAVLQAMHRPAPDIYDTELLAMVDGMIPELKAVAQTAHEVAIYICNGHGAWEASLSNTVAPGEVVLVPTCGRFGHGWAEMAEGLGIEVQILEHGRQTPIDAERVRAALLADKGQRIKAVLAVHVDTSSSVRSDIAALRRVLDEVGHPALLMADCVASLACDVYRMDAWGADVTVSACQKGLMVPPGMGFVFFNPRAAEVQARMPRVSRYWDWRPRAHPEMFYQYFGGTAPTHHLYGLRAALDMIGSEGLEAVWARHARLAGALWAAVEHWGEEGAMRLNIADPAQRSHAVTALSLGKGNGDRLRAWCRDVAGVTLGIGLGAGDDEDPTASGYFRIGHMGHINAHMMLGVLAVIETGLKALDIPHRPGGVTVAAQRLAD
ncbi:pyridoxal-phosphate-dependent aminotransferase family protein [Sagittula salina]|uniref:Aminotransferase class V-fold PLP-dependent enzyme n=1 Tax=Sagittula salina TaxID=2820268 RepID=A0A940MQ37_9RHOB|nr:aminotransferase class V-fold PLP-dependent enzyme [Sagittula salina]MBP0483384.1 aminotransferase class V-fold PLP-dependent enzyme [Sagittula salina]